MNWITKKLFGFKKSPHEDLAEKLYQVLVLDGGPSGDAENRIDADTLEIPLDKLERFAQKRLVSLEALFFVSVQIGTAKQSEKLQVAFGDGMLHPLAIETGKLICSKWSGRGIDITEFAVAERCFNEVEEFLEKPFVWGRKWLDEFYENTEKSSEHYIKWTDQWLKEFKTMGLMADQYS